MAGKRYTPGFEAARLPVRRLARSPGCPFAHSPARRSPACSFARFPVRPSSGFLVGPFACLPVRLFARSPICRLACRPVRQPARAAAYARAACLPPATRHPSIGTASLLTPVPHDSFEHLSPDSPRSPRCSSRFIVSLTCAILSRFRLLGGMPRQYPNVTSVIPFDSSLRGFKRDCNREIRTSGCMLR